jgi:hypothetical protein
MFIRSMRLFLQPWQTARFIKFKRVHQYFGYFLIFVVQSTVCTGIMAKVDASGQTMQHYSGFIFCICNLLGMIIVLTCCEVNHRAILAREIDWQVKKQPSMSKAEFHRAVKCGQHFVILDEMVLDLSKFVKHHPGGKFALI